MRTVDKTYLALVRGGSQSFPQRAGQIRTPLKYPDGRASLVQESELQDPEQQPKESKTDWEVVASSVRCIHIPQSQKAEKATKPHLPLSLLRLRLLTGHKHQLRVHLAQVLKSLSGPSDLTSVPILTVCFSSHPRRHSAFTKPPS